MIQRAKELWLSISPKGRTQIVRMIWINFLCVWVIVLWAFFSGQLTLPELLDLIPNFHEHEPITE